MTDTTYGAGSAHDETSIDEVAFVNMLRNMLSKPDDSGFGLTKVTFSGKSLDDLRQLLATVDRLRAELARANEQIAALDAEREGDRP